MSLLPFPYPSIQQLENSVNSELPFGNKYEDDNVRVMGKVLGVTQPDDIASDDLVSVLEELLADDVKAFEQEHRR